MTINYVRGDLLKSDCDALVNPVNTVGVMGAGLALQFKKAFPENFRLYRQCCSDGALEIGKVLVVERSQGSPRWIFNVPTKRHWRQPAELSYVKRGLVRLVRELVERNVGSVAVPMLGCGLGGLNWVDVKPHLEHAFSALSGVRFDVYEQ